MQDLQSPGHALGGRALAGLTAPIEPASLAAGPGAGDTWRGDLSFDAGGQPYQQFVACFLRGASRQDIYASDATGYANGAATEVSDPVALQRGRTAAHKEFVRVFDHLKDLADPIDRTMQLAGKDVLDFGCGTGALSVALASRGARVTACDPTQESLDAVKWRAAAFGLPEQQVRTQVISPLPGLPFADGSFDVVISNSVLEFIPQHRDLYIKDMVRLLRPGGCLVVSTENGLFPRDYYTRKLFPLLRRRRMVAANLPYGSTYFEIRRWARTSARPVVSLSERGHFNSLDKFNARLAARGRRWPARVVSGANTLLKSGFGALHLPSDILFPYTTFIFRVL